MGITLVPEFHSITVYQPLSHIYGHATVLQSLLIGSTCVIMPKFELEAYLSLNAEYKVWLDGKWKSPKHTGMALKLLKVQVSPRK